MEGGGGRRRRSRGERDEARTYGLRCASTPAMRVGRSTESARASRSTLTAVPAERAVAWLRALAAPWTAADVPEAKADLLHAISGPATVIRS
jgi:hypothetical protein